MDRGALIGHDKNAQMKRCSRCRFAICPIAAISSRRFFHADKDEDELVVCMLLAHSLKHRREIGDPPEDTFQVEFVKISIANDWPKIGIEFRFQQCQFLVRYIHWLISRNCQLVV